MNFELEFFDSIDSTSSYAVRKLNQVDLNKPLVIWALEQSQGRGRFSRTWLSPKGNIYVSFVFPYNLNLSIDSQYTDKFHYISIISGIIVAKWILNTFNIRITLKWPNDIFFAGKKLGGILCESQIKGSILKAIIIGIGINLNNAPLIQDMFYESICLKEIVRFVQEYDVKSYGLEFINFFYYNWNEYLSYDLNQLLIDFDKFSFERGHLWVDGDNKFFKYEGIGSQGEMLLEDLDNIKKHKVFSVSHDYVWIYQFFKNKKFFPIITSTLEDRVLKLAFFRYPNQINPVLIYNGIYDANTNDLKLCLDNFKAELCKCLDSKCVQWPIFLVKDRNSTIQISYINRNFYFVNIVKRTLLSEIKYVDNFELLRLCAIEYCLSLYSSKQVLVLVNFRTSFVCIDVIYYKTRQLIVGFNFNNLNSKYCKHNLEVTTTNCFDGIELANEFLASFTEVSQSNTFVSGLCVSNFIKALLLKISKTLYLDKNDIEIILVEGYISILDKSLLSEYTVRLEPNAVFNGIKLMALGGLIN